MPTYCTFCKKEINEESEENKGKKYLYCPCGHGLVPKGSNIKLVKGGNNNKMPEKKVKKEKAPKVEKEPNKKALAAEDVLSYINDKYKGFSVEEKMSIANRVWSQLRKKKSE